MTEEKVRRIANQEIDLRLKELTEADEGIVNIKTPLELKIEKKRKEKDWIQEQLLP